MVESEKKVVFVIDNALHMSYDRLSSCDLHPSIDISEVCSRACITWHRPAQEEVVSLGLEVGICCVVAVCAVLLVQEIGCWEYPNT